MGAVNFDAVDFDVVVVGAGVVGGSLAVALADGGLKVALVDAKVEASPPAQAGGEALFDSRVFALRPASRRFLEGCEIWQHIDPRRLAPVYRMVVTGDDGVSQLGFDAYRSGVSELAVIVENASLQAALRAALDERSHVVRLAGRRCEQVQWTDAAVSVGLDDGQRLSAGLLVAADGAHSPVRTLAGIGVKQHAYGHNGVVANFESESEHGGTAWQWFRPDGVLALLPLPGQRVSMVWSTPQAHAEELLRLPGQALAARVAEAAGGQLGALRPLGAAASFPLQWMRADRITAARLAVVGDAAHNVHPLAGQGLNLGLADAQSLAAAIAARGADQPGSDAVLARYRRSRAEEIMAMQFTTDGLHHLFQSPAPGVARLRNLGLRLTDRCAPIKGLLVKHAAG